MNRLRFALGSAFLAFAMSFLVTPASAQATRTWVSGVGDDVNPCSRTAPCKTFAGAISKTATSGEINCLDPAGYGSVTITKSITIDCHYTAGSILSAGTNGIIVNAPAGSIVNIRGIDINGAATGIDGIRFIGQGQLHVEDVTIKRVTGQGLEVAHNGPSEIYVSNTRISETGAEAILIKTTVAAGLNAIITNVEATNSGSGIKVDGTGNTSPMNLLVEDSIVSGNSANGITVLTVAGNSQIRASVFRSTISSNAGVGLNSSGASASGVGSAAVFLGDSAIFANVTGVSVTGAGILQSFKNNMIFGNLTDGTPLTAVPAPGGPLQ